MAYLHLTDITCSCVSGLIVSGTLYNLPLSKEHSKITLHCLHLGRQYVFSNLHMRKLYYNHGPEDLGTWIGTSDSHFTRILAARTLPQSYTHCLLMLRRFVKWWSYMEYVVNLVYSLHIADASFYMYKWFTVGKSIDYEVLSFLFDKLGKLSETHFQWVMSLIFHIQKPFCHSNILVHPRPLLAATLSQLAAL